MYFGYYGSTFIFFRHHKPYNNEEPEVKNSTQQEISEKCNIVEILLRIRVPKYTYFYLFCAREQNIPRPLQISIVGVKQRICDSILMVFLISGVRCDSDLNDGKNSVLEFRHISQAVIAFCPQNWTQESEYSVTQVLLLTIDYCIHFFLFLRPNYENEWLFC